jgi:hypothetical protein
MAEVRPHCDGHAGRRCEDADNLNSYTTGTGTGECPGGVGACRPNNFLDLFLEPNFKHLVCLIKNLHAPPIRTVRRTASWLTVSSRGLWCLLHSTQAARPRLLARSAQHAQRSLGRCGDTLALGLTKRAADQELGGREAQGTAVEQVDHAPRGAHHRINSRSQRAPLHPARIGQPRYGQQVIQGEAAN